jgi:hypothetical protein
MQTLGIPKWPSHAHFQDEMRLAEVGASASVDACLAGVAGILFPGAGPAVLQKNAVSDLSDLSAQVTRLPYMLPYVAMLFLIPKTFWMALCNVCVGPHARVLAGRAGRAFLGGRVGLPQSGGSH